MGEQINARDWTFEVSDNAATPAWTEIAGIESFSLNPADGEAEADTTTFASGGVAESQIMQRGASLALTGKRITDGAGVIDPGQAQCDANAGEVGQASLCGIRFAHVDDTEWTVWTGTFSLSEQSGGTNDKTSWGVSVKRSGAATTAAKP